MKEKYELDAFDIDEVDEELEKSRTPSLIEQKGEKEEEMKEDEMMKEGEGARKGLFEGREEEEEGKKEKKDYFDWLFSNEEGKIEERSLQEFIREKNEIDVFYSPLSPFQNSNNIFVTSFKNESTGTHFSLFFLKKSSRKEEKKEKKGKQNQEILSLKSFYNLQHDCVLLRMKLASCHSLALEVGMEAFELCEKLSFKGGDPQANDAPPSSLQSYSPFSVESFLSSWTFSCVSLFCDLLKNEEEANKHFFSPQQQSQFAFSWNLNILPLKDELSQLATFPMFKVFPIQFLSMEKATKVKTFVAIPPSLYSATNPNQNGHCSLIFPSQLDLLVLEDENGSNGVKVIEFKQLNDKYGKKETISSVDFVTIQQKQLSSFLLSSTFSNPNFKVIQPSELLTKEIIEKAEFALELEMSGNSKSERKAKKRKNKRERSEKKKKRQQQNKPKVLDI